MYKKLLNVIVKLAEKVAMLADNQMRIYEKGVTDGKQAEYDAFWDAYQLEGNQKTHPCAFAGPCWDDITFKPKYDMWPTTANQMFMYSGITDLEAALQKAGVKLDMSRCTNANQMFAGSTMLTVIPELDMSSCTYSKGSLSQMFIQCSKLKTIRKIILRNDGLSTFTTNDFAYASELENVTFEGVIANNNLNFSSNTKLTHESLMSIIGCLYDWSGDTSSSTHTITLGSTNKAKLTDEELSIARNKGWTVS